MANLVELTTELTELLKTHKVGNRSSVRQYLLRAQEQSCEEAIARASLENLIEATQKAKALTALLVGGGKRFIEQLNISRPVGTQWLDFMGMEEDELITLGHIVIDIIVKAGWAKIDKYPVMEFKALPTSFLEIPDGSDLDILVKADVQPELKANTGYHEWTEPTMIIGGREIDIVKKARRFGMLGNYTKDKIPSRYNSMNREAKVEWMINSKVLKVMSEEPSENNFIPKPPSEDELKTAKATISGLQRTGLFVAEMRFKFLTETYQLDVKKATKRAKAVGSEWVEEKRKVSDKILTDWSKHRDYSKCIELANEYIEDTLNFLWTMDTRGRKYVVNQNYLNPQGADYAKALLMFANPKLISDWDFKVCTASHAGQDKISFEDRIKWFDKNAENILNVGRDTWGKDSMSFMSSMGIDKEDKSKFQFIACCIEYAEYADSGFADDFLCKIPTAYDGTNQGLQILSAIGRDDYVAPYVNITETEKPGDIYQLIGSEVAEFGLDIAVQNATEALRVNNDPSKVNRLQERLVAATNLKNTLGSIDKDSKIWRSVAKRGVMTKAYDATRYGMGQQCLEDKPQKIEDDKSGGLWFNLDQDECRILGEAIYDACKKHLTAAHNIMITVKKAVENNTKDVAQWTLPDGFIAFQACPKKEDKHQLDLTIGGKRVQLALYKLTKNADKRKHSSSCAANFTHSLDAYLLSTLINGMPEGANLAMVHDSFASDSVYGMDIQENAKVAYQLISNRTEVVRMLTEMAGGVQVELPTEGSWDPEELLKADYVVC